MKPGDKVSLKNAINKTVGIVMRPAAPDINSTWVIKVNDKTEIVASESDLEPA